jgi:hypothetical protein
MGPQLFMPLVENAGQPVCYTYLVWIEGQSGALNDTFGLVLGQQQYDTIYLFCDIFGLVSVPISAMTRYI